MLTIAGDAGGRGIGLTPNIAENDGPQAVHKSLLTTRGKMHRRMCRQARFGVRLEVGGVSMNVTFVIFFWYRVLCKKVGGAEASNDWLCTPGETKHIGRRDPSFITARNDEEDIMQRNRSKISAAVASVGCTHL